MIRPIRHPGPSERTRRTPTHRVIRRAADRTNDWHQAADGTEETRTFFLHNLRGDLVATLDTDGAPQEEFRYTPYGVPILLSLADTNGDGITNATDFLAISGNLGSTTLDDEDLDRDGEVDNDDYNLALNVWWGVSDERGALTRGDDDTHAHSGQRKGYAAYEHTFFDDEVMHVRHRVYLAELGRWTKRDPAGYVDGMNVYGYARLNPVAGNDPWGLFNQFIPPRFDPFLAPPTQADPREQGCVGVSCEIRTDGDDTQLVPEPDSAVFGRVTGSVVDILLAALKAGDDLTTIALCNKCQQYKRSRSGDPTYQPDRDPYYQMLKYYCRVASGHATLKRVCCGRYLPSGDVAYTISEVACPSHMSDQDCCDLIPGGNPSGTAAPPPPHWRKSPVNCDLCDELAGGFLGIFGRHHRYDCTPKSWKGIPGSPIRYP